MRKAIVMCAIFAIMLSQQASAGILRYLTGYCMNREFAAQHAPSAVSRAPLVRARGEAIQVEIKHGRIMWVRFVPNTKRAKFEVRYLEPAFYYVFMPLVELDCALNGHPACPDHHWRFFGPNAEYEPRH